MEPTSEPIIELRFDWPDNDADAALAARRQLVGALAKQGVHLDLTEHDELPRMISLPLAGSVECLQRLLADGAEPTAVYLAHTYAQPEQAEEARALVELAKAAELELPDASEAVESVLAAHPAEVAALRAGDGRQFGFLFGQVMRREPDSDVHAVNLELHNRFGQ